MPYVGWNFDRLLPLGEIIHPWAKCCWEAPSFGFLDHHEGDSAMSLVSDPFETIHRLAMKSMDFLILQLQVNGRFLPAFPVMAASFAGLVTPPPSGSSHYLHSILQFGPEKGGPPPTLRNTASTACASSDNVT